MAKSEGDRLPEEGIRSHLIHTYLFSVLLETSYVDGLTLAYAIYYNQSRAIASLMLDLWRSLVASYSLAVQTAQGTVLP